MKSNPDLSPGAFADIGGRGWFRLTQSGDPAPRLKWIGCRVSMSHLGSCGPTMLIDAR
jgi:hypothetical protein